MESEIKAFFFFELLWSESDSYDEISDRMFPCISVGYIFKRKEKEGQIPYYKRKKFHKRLLTSLFMEVE